MRPVIEKMAQQSKKKMENEGERSKKLSVHKHTSQYIRASSRNTSVELEVTVKPDAKLNFRNLEAECER